jgi:hypothetical protein
MEASQRWIPCYPNRKAAASDRKLKRVVLALRLELALRYISPELREECLAIARRRRGVSRYVARPHSTAARTAHRLLRLAVSGSWKVDCHTAFSPDFFRRLEQARLSEHDAAVWSNIRDLPADRRHTYRHPEKANSVRCRNRNRCNGYRRRGQWHAIRATLRLSTRRPPPPKGDSFFVRALRRRGREAEGRPFAAGERGP